MVDNDERKTKNHSRPPSRLMALILLVIGLVTGIALTTSLAVLLWFVPAQTVVVTAAPAPIIDSTPTAVPFITATPFPTSPALTATPIMPTVPPAGTPIASRLSAVALTTGGMGMAYASNDGLNGQIIYAERGRPVSLFGDVQTLFGGYGTFNDLIFNDSGTLLLATSNTELSQDGRALLFSIPDGQIVAEYAQISGGAFSPDGTQLALVGARNGIRLIDLTTTRLIEATAHDAYAVGEVDFNQFGQIAVSLDNRLELYNASDLSSPLQSFTLQTNFIYDLAFHPDGRHLALAGDGFVQVMNIDLGTSETYAFDASRIHAVAFSADGQWLAVGGGFSGIGEGRLRVLRWGADAAQSGAVPSTPITLDGHNHVVTDLAFTPDGYLVSASWDGSLRLWDVDNGQMISSLYP